MIKRQPLSCGYVKTVIPLLLIVGGGLVYGSDLTTVKTKSIPTASTLETEHEQLQDMTPLIDYEIKSNPLKSAVSWTIGLGSNLFWLMLGLSFTMKISSSLDSYQRSAQVSKTLSNKLNYEHSTWMSYTMPWEEFKAVRTFLSGETINNRNAYIQEILNQIIPTPRQFEYEKSDLRKAYNWALDKTIRQQGHSSLQYELWNEEFYQKLDINFLGKLGHYSEEEVTCPFQANPFARARLLAWNVVENQRLDITTQIQWSREKQIHGAIDNVVQYDLARINAQQRKERWAANFSPAVRNAIADWSVNEQDAKTFDDEIKMFESYYQMQTHGSDRNVMDDIRKVFSLDPEFTLPCPELRNIDIIRNARDILMENKTYDLKKIGDTEEDANVDIFFWGEIKWYNVERFRESLIGHPSPWIQAIGYHYPTFKRVLCHVIHECTHD